MEGIERQILTDTKAIRRLTWGIINGCNPALNDGNVQTASDIELAFIFGCHYSGDVGGPNWWTNLHTFISWTIVVNTQHSQRAVANSQAPVPILFQSFSISATTLCTSKKAARVKCGYCFYYPFWLEKLISFQLSN